MLLCAAVAVTLLLSGKTRTQAISGLVVVLVGVPVYFAWRTVSRPAVPAL
jgi:uncharacterized membrane protein